MVFLVLSLGTFDTVVVLTEKKLYYRFFFCLESFQIIVVSTYLVVSCPWIICTQGIRTQAQTFRTHFLISLYPTLWSIRTQQLDTKCLKQT